MNQSWELRLLSNRSETLRFAGYGSKNNEILSNMSTYESVA